MRDVFATLPVYFLGPVEKLLFFTWKFFILNFYMLKMYFCTLVLWSAE